MLGSYMEDIGISPEQFEAACGVASKKIKSQFHHALFEQVRKEKTKKRHSISFQLQHTLIFSCRFGQPTILKFSRG